MIYVAIPTTPDREKRAAFAVECVKKSQCDQEIKIIVKLNDYEGFVKPMLEIVNNVDGLVLFVGDDTETTPTAIQRLYDAYMKNFPNNDGMCVPNDGLPNVQEILGTHALAHTKVWREVIHPGYFHNFVDKEWTYIMKARCKYVFVPDALVIHRHHYREKNIMDKTYEVANAMSDKDGLLFEERKAHNFYQ